MADPTLDEFVHSTLRNAPVNTNPQSGRPLDADTIADLPERPLDDGLRLERIVLPEAPDLIVHRVVDRNGQMRGIAGFEWDAMEVDIPERTLARVRRGHPPGKLRLVG